MRAAARALLALAVLAPALAAGVARADEPVSLRVRVFPGVQNLPLFAGQARGLFAKHGIRVELQFTPGSPALRAGLVAGDFEVAHAAVDNAVAMAEAGADVVVVLGGEGSMNRLFVQPGIRSVADLRGRTVIVDAPDTGYALQLRKILRDQGLEAGRDYTVRALGATIERLRAMREQPEYAASMLNPPFSIIAERAGLHSLGLAVTLLGPYQATGGFVRRAWARAHATDLEAYIQGYVEAVRWALAPANRAEAVALLADRLRLEPDVAAATYAEAVDPAGGLTPDARLDPAGFGNVLAIRAELTGQWGGHPPPAERYVDLGYYGRALAALGR